jgi:uncharacterized protein (TIGR02996 family)
MSHAAFLNTIREHPDADLPRLVFADWLDEAGDPARAEFIRLQCELASLPDHDPQFRQLEDRDHELLSDHEPAWAGELPRYATEWEWRRGFVEDVTFALHQYAHADEAVGGQSVTRLSLTGGAGARSHDSMAWDRCRLMADVRHFDLTGLTFNQHWGTRELVAQWFLQSASMPRLTGLAFRDVRADPFLPDALSLCPAVAKLDDLSFAGAAGGTPLDPIHLHLALHRSRLRALALSDFALSDFALADLFRFEWTSTLAHLDVSANPLTPNAYRAFAGAPPEMRLESLDVSGTPLAGISLEPLLDTPSCESLTKLEMNGCGSARRNMEVLSRSRFWTQATHLRAHSGTIPASTLEPLCGSSGPPALRLLDLADNYLRTEGVRMLCDAPWSEPLTWLALSRNYLDDDSLRALANSRLRDLRTLHLAHNNLTQDRSDGELVTDIGVSWLTDSPVLANLRLLTLGYTGISDRSVELVLKRAHWRLFGLGIAGNNLTGETVRILATSPRLSRLVWLDLSGNPRLGGRELLPLAESPHLSRLCELDCGGIPMADEVRSAFRERLGPRFSD